MIWPSKKLERSLLQNGYRYICAVDEVGMGCLAGPVVACAIIINKQFHDGIKKTNGIRDSKLLSAIQRARLAAKLINTPGLNYAISYSHPKTIDRLNIRQSAQRTATRAVEKICKPSTITLVDGPNELQNLATPQKAIVKGDRKVFAIACASILAKVYRDKMMIRYSKRYPNYGFEKHKGYGTQEHKTMLIKHGPCILHRLSFRWQKAL